ncbi:hypothetical protein OHA25_14180 [Nonomuraea sp. NBC_00507]|uniref:hypothetical protein n=1 Tax=Nonomuraea sp. NBC_00507 TaxID=2976002 RepID=UPI002E16CECD
MALLDETSAGAPARLLSDLRAKLGDVVADYPVRHLHRAALASVWSAAHKSLSPRPSQLDPFMALIDQMLRTDLDEA